MIFVKDFQKILIFRKSEIFRFFENPRFFENSINRNFFFEHQQFFVLLKSQNFIERPFRNTQQHLLTPPERGERLNELSRFWSKSKISWISCFIVFTQIERARSPRSGGVRRCCCVFLKGFSMMFWDFIQKYFLMIEIFFVDFRKSENLGFSKNQGLLIFRKSEIFWFFENPTSLRKNFKPSDFFLQMWNQEILFFCNANDRDRRI